MYNRIHSKFRYNMGIHSTDVSMCYTTRLTYLKREGSRYC